MSKTPPLTKYLPFIIIIWINILLIIMVFPRICQTPIIHDVPNLHIIAQRVLAGDIPYRDIFDMNLPGIYFIHAFVLLLPVEIDLAWFIFHYSMAILCAFMVFVIVRRESLLGGILAATTILLMYSTRKVYYFGQRDFLIMIPILISYWSFLKYSESNPTNQGYIFLSGFMIGLSITIKPYPILFFVFILIELIRHLRKLKSPCFVPFVLFTLGLTIPYLLIFTWLAINHALMPFMDIILRALPVYSAWNQLPFKLMFTYLIVESRFYLILVALLSLSTALLPKFPKISSSLRFIAAGCIYGLVHYFVQAKGWEYHQFPFLIFTIMLCSIMLTRLFETKHTLYKSLAVIGLLLPYIGYLPKSAWIIMTNPNEYLDIFQPAVNKLIVDYADLGMDEKSIQMMDMTGGGNYLLFLKNQPLHTPYLLDFMFYESKESGYLAYRNDFINRLSTNSPDFIVIFRGEGTESIRPVEKYGTWIELSDLIKSKYKLEKDREEYSIYKLSEKKN